MAACCCVSRGCRCGKNEHSKDKSARVLFPSFVVFGVASVHPTPALWLRLRSRDPAATGHGPPPPAPPSPTLLFCLSSRRLASTPHPARLQGSCALRTSLNFNMSPAAPLSIPVPADVAGTTSSGTIRSHDGLDLHFKRFHPPSSVPVQASVVFVHGFIEYIDRYNETFPLFAARGIELIAFDQRGFGQTAMKAQGGWKTHYSNTTWPQQFEDAKAVVAEQRRWLDEKYGSGKISLFLLGHSMVSEGVVGASRLLLPI